MDLWLEEKDAIVAGRMPMRNEDGLRLECMANSFLEFKETLVESGELNKRSWHDLREECKRLITHFGRERFADDIQPDDFAKYRKFLGKGRSIKTLDNIINRQRSIFNWAYKNQLLGQPAKFGSAFDRPSKKSIRRE